jgi:hypothetical protein
MYIQGQADAKILFFIDWCNRNQSALRSQHRKAEIFAEL